MELTERQLLTLKHLQEDGYDTLEQVIEWCNLRINRPRYTNKNNHKYKRSETRKYSIKYYKNIINFLEQSPRTGKKGNHE